MALRDVCYWNEKAAFNVLGYSLRARSCGRHQQPGESDISSHKQQSLSAQCQTAATAGPSLIVTCDPLPNAKDSKEQRGGGGGGGGGRGGGGGGGGVALLPPIMEMTETLRSRC
ncbi:unnamed protein product [Pleuronectes platessa]|uniref:Uncharacterized protein n=1 Tax=Pleuronectes platessa TaxID=8262 RepID=A0A9N7YL19_PLEPL|nr:unnamed protein product [Pleuronectes platessa]